MKKILVTGAAGFIGSALLKCLRGRSDYCTFASVRKLPCNLDCCDHTVEVGCLSSEFDWSVSLTGIDVVIHLAARAHILHETASDPLEEFRAVNVNGTAHLAKYAVEAGVKRFIFLSSIGVNGSKTDIPFTETDVPNPVYPYAVSKLEAEQALRKIANESGLDVVIIRPPLVYGASAPGNFRRLLDLVNMGIPIPLGAVHDKRTLIALDNLIDLIATCVDHPGASNQLFLAGDSEDLSTTELLRHMVAASGKRNVLFPVPVSILRLLAIVLRQQFAVKQLCSSLQIDSSKAQNVLHWHPVISAEQAVKEAVNSYHRDREATS